MSIISILLLGVGLSMDAFAVSIAKGMVMQKKEVLKYACILALFFGGFQALMPLLGWWIGSYFETLIASVDHWIAFGLLGIIGMNMIREAFQCNDGQCDHGLSIISLFVLAISTSIDSLAVGISFAFLNVDIGSAVLMIGCTTFLLSFIAVYIGNRLGGFFEKYAGIFGGIILFGIGTKILLEHLLS